MHKTGGCRAALDCLLPAGLWPPSLPSPNGGRKACTLTPALSRKRERELKAQRLCTTARQLQDWRASS